MYRFALVNYKGWGNPKVKSWMLMVETTKELYEFLEVRRQQFTRSYFNAKTNTSKGIHHKTSEEILIEFYFQNAIDNGFKGKNLLDDLELLGKHPYIESYISIFRESDRGILVNPSYGFFGHNKKDVKIYKIVKNEEFEFPFDGEGNIRVMQWPGGNHWYAKIGNQDVVIDGEQKWYSRNKAIKMAKEFIKSGVS